MGKFTSTYNDNKKIQYNYISKYMINQKCVLYEKERCVYSSITVGNTAAPPLGTLLYSSSTLYMSKEIFISNEVEGYADGSIATGNTSFTR